MTAIGLITPQQGYKPFRYPQAYSFWLKQQQVHWLPNEVPLASDVKDYAYGLTPSEKHLLTQIFRFFTQADIEVNDCYHRQYLAVFEPTEVKMMLTAFSNIETVHIAAYSHLLDTVGMPETEYKAFLQYEEMKAKSAYLKKFQASKDDPRATAMTMAAFGGFTEGLQLFASFAILLNFPRFSKMKGMGQIITWSVRDESLHCDGITWLWKQWLKEHGMKPAEFKDELHSVADEMVRHEDAFIDLCFSMGAVKGLSPQEVKAYIRFIADMRLKNLGVAKLYGIKKNPLPWLEEMLNGVEHANFFEQRSTEYSKAAMTGSWTDVWERVGKESAPQ